MSQESGQQQPCCYKKKCKGGADSVVFICSQPRCRVAVCTQCSAAIIEKYKLPGLPPPHKVVCTKTCYVVTLKYVNKNAQIERKPWDSDTPDLSFEGSSQAKLIEWMCAPGNYSRWKGNKHGVSKQEIQKQIAETLNREGLEMGIERNRTDEQVGNRIEYLQSRFKETFDWAHGTTGQGLLVDSGADSFREAVKQKFKWYYDLLPIMQDRSSTKPTMLSDELRLSSDDEDNNDDKDNNNIFETGIPDDVQPGPPRNTTYDSPVAVIRVPSRRSSDCASSVGGGDVATASSGKWKERPQET